VVGPFQSLIFDFDYTLADSSRGIVECINFALRELGLHQVSAERARRTIGLSLADAFAELAGPQDPKSSEFARLFVERADQVMLDLTFLLDSVPETVALLKRRGFALGILSNKFRYRVTGALRRENLLASFDTVIGAEDVAELKPAPEGLLLAIERLGNPAPATLYVGDSVTDAETAARAGVPFVAVLSGVTPREAFDGYDTYAVLVDVSALPRLLGI